MYSKQRRIAAGGAPSTHKPPTIPDSIIQIALNRTGKSRTTTSSTTTPVTTSEDAAARPNAIGQLTDSPEKPTLSKAEIARGQQDIQTINNDLKLLSTLLGRPISVNELPTITQQFGGGGGIGDKTANANAASVRGNSRRAPVTTTTTTMTTTTTTLAPTTTTSTQKPDILREAELLQSLLRQQQKQSDSRPEYYGKTDDAILATILKQQGIGPSHNNLPIDVSVCVGRV